jgi:hypothetical protein
MPVPGSPSTIRHNHRDTEDTEGYWFLARLCVLCASVVRLRCTRRLIPGASAWIRRDPGLFVLGGLVCMI